MRILIAEDNLVIGEQIKQSLTDEGHAVDISNDGEQAAFLAETEPYDLIILDIGLPKQDGLSVLKGLRQKSIDAPVIILTARDSWSEKIDGLDAGADDYITKPFHMPELTARVRSLLRRKAGLNNPLITKGNFNFDTRTGKAFIDGFFVALTAQETAVLSYLVHNPGRFISRTELSEHIYAYDDDRDSNTIAVFIRRLRKKLGADLIQTERGRGYLFEVE